MKQQSQRTQLLLRLKEHLVSHSLVSYISLPRLPKQNTEAAWQDTQQGIVSHRSGSCKFQDQDGSQVGFSRVLFCLTGSPVLLCGTKIAGFFSLSLLLIIYLFGGGAHVPQHTPAAQKTVCQSWFSPSIVWVPGIDLRLSVLAASRLPAEPSCQSAPPFPQRHQSYLARALPL